jgi:hypothetical protein
MATSNKHPALTLLTKPHEGRIILELDKGMRFTTRSGESEAFNRGAFGSRSGG